MKPTGQTPHGYGLALAQITLISILTCLFCLLTDASDAILLAGRVTSSAGAALAGVPVRAQRENSNIVVTVFSDRRGEYSFPAWSNISAGTYSVAILLPDYERVQRDAVVLGGPLWVWRKR